MPCANFDNANFGASDISSHSVTLNFIQGIDGDREEGKRGGKWGGGGGGGKMSALSALGLLVRQLFRHTDIQ